MGSSNQRIARAVAVLFLSGVHVSEVPAADCGATAYDCALFHVGRREFAPAVAYLEKQLAAAPRDLKALNLLGIALTGAGQRDAASARFREALKLDPSFYPARKNLAINEYDSGRPEDARRHLEAVLKLAPDDPIANLYLAEIHFQAKRHQAALAHYEKSGDRYAQQPLWTLHYARCLIGYGRAEQAAAVLDRLPREDGAAQFEAGVALGEAGAHADAARFFAAARKSHRDPYAAGFNQALMLIEAGQHEAAIAVVREVASAGPVPAELLSLASRAYLGAGRVQEAYDALREAIRLEPKAPEHYVDLALICLEHDNFDLGLEIVDIGLGQLPESSLLYLQRGVLRAMKGEMVEAEKDFDSARRLSPGDPMAYAALGMVWMQSGQTARAVEVLRAELDRRQGHVVPYIFAVALLRSGADPSAPEATEAVAALRASIEANPDFSPARAELGRLLFKRDELEPAIAELEKAVALDPEATPALYTLSQAYRKTGDTARAQELLERVSRLNAEERGEDRDGELRRAVVRIVREGAAPRRPARAP